MVIQSIMSSYSNHYFKLYPQRSFICCNHAVYQCCHYLFFQPPFTKSLYPSKTSITDIIHNVLSRKHNVHFSNILTNFIVLPISFCHNSSDSKITKHLFPTPKIFSSEKKRLYSHTTNPCGVFPPSSCLLSRENGGIRTSKNEPSVLSTLNVPL